MNVLHTMMEKYWEFQAKFLVFEISLTCKEVSFCVLYFYIDFFRITSRVCKLQNYCTNFRFN